MLWTYYWYSVTFGDDRTKALICLDFPQAIIIDEELVNNWDSLETRTKAKYLTISMVEWMKKRGDTLSSPKNKLDVPKCFSVQISG